jgi:hypothetical protein
MKAVLHICVVMDKDVVIYKDDTLVCKGKMLNIVTMTSFLHIVTFYNRI